MTIPLRCQLQDYELRGCSYISIVQKHNINIISILFVANILSLLFEKKKLGSLASRTMYNFKLIILHLAEVSNFLRHTIGLNTTSLWVWRIDVSLALRHILTPDSSRQRSSGIVIKVVGKHFASQNSSTSLTDDIFLRLLWHATLNNTNRVWRFSTRIYLTN